MLLLACDIGSRDTVQYLLEEKKVDVASSTKDGKTGLHLAALHDHREVAEMLVAHGISLTAQDNEWKKKDSDERFGVGIYIHVYMCIHLHELLNCQSVQQYILEIFCRLSFHSFMTIYENQEHYAPPLFGTIQ